MKEDYANELLFSTLFCLNHDDSRHLPDESVMNDLINEAKERFEIEEFLIMLKRKFVIVGDIHGDLYSLIRIFEKMGYPPETKYLFLGDYVDRGKYSVEVMILLLSLKVLYSNSVYLLRGNHESRSLSMSYGFYDECVSKFNEAVYDYFISLFEELPCAAMINGKIFCVHGGISKDEQDIYNVIFYTKPKSTDNATRKQIIHDFLWSDPSNCTEFFADNDRGPNTYVFGEKALDSFLEKNCFSCIIRGHQMCMNGYDQPFESNKCWTVFSSADYCERWNTAAVLVVEDGNVKEVVTLDPESEEEIKSHKILLPEWLIQTAEAFPMQVDQIYLDDISFFDEVNHNLLVEDSL